MNGRLKIHTPTIPKPICWRKTPRGWHKLNIDGSSIRNLGKAGTGAIIRNDLGKWVIGSSRYLGITTNIVTKYWGLSDGLQLAINLGITKLAIEL